MSMTIGVTWARGKGSTLPGKNKYPVLGKPLIHYPLTELKKSGTVDYHYVFTEDDKIADTALETGWRVVPRPRYLISYNDKEFSLQKAWKIIAEHVASDLNLDIPKFNGNWGSAFRLLSDYSFSMNCNNCMVRSKTYQGMFRTMKENKLPMVVPAARSYEQLMLAHEEGYLFPVWNDPGLNRQYYPKTYKPLLNTFFQNPRLTVTGRPMRYYYEIEEIESMDVHTEFDIDFIEYYLQTHPDYFE
ncbi:hypothetical protein DSCW_11630 [Desulfosarcina widdelii]|uniref:Acylneuraminate cytidylyltransferase n=1 Tax=Desulfosarcina widdelii TaxID=947919 RepID=A0A5K7YWN5_9BACT|nr:hypothetical protein [Desulfosarcina widdelii]BBO73746.1 hypothetical protein DSCW_11630 [Desulfosarcina widdelii]